jgi:threonyl-tRNA synthetase
MIHRAPFGSMERFVAVLIEHCAGNFPLWLSPEQFAILPISEKYHEYAQQVYDRLLQEDIRGHIDTRDEKIGRKIRDAEVQKIPYMLIVGEKEQENNIIAVRKHGIGDMGNLTVDLFISNFKSMVEDILSKK